jgi:hypothetical protein
VFPPPVLWDSSKLQVTQMVKVMRLVLRLLSRGLLLWERRVALVRLEFQQAVVLQSFSTSAIQTLPGDRH